MFKQEPLFLAWPPNLVVDKLATAPLIDPLNKVEKVSNTSVSYRYFPGIILA